MSANLCHGECLWHPGQTWLGEAPVWHHSTWMLSCSSDTSLSWSFQSFFWQMCVWGNFKLLRLLFAVSLMWVTSHGQDPWAPGTGIWFSLVSQLISLKKVGSAWDHLSPPPCTVPCWHPQLLLFKHNSFSQRAFCQAALTEIHFTAALGKKIFLSSRSQDNSHLGGWSP